MFTNAKQDISKNRDQLLISFRWEWRQKCIISLDQYTKGSAEQFNTVFNNMHMIFNLIPFKNSTHTSANLLLRHLLVHISYLLIVQLPAVKMQNLGHQLTHIIASAAD